LLCLFSSLSCFYPPPAPTHIYTLSLHDALPISLYLIANASRFFILSLLIKGFLTAVLDFNPYLYRRLRIVQEEMFNFKSLLILRSEEHTSELQSRENLVCRLLLEKKKKNTVSYS